MMKITLHLGEPVADALANRAAAEIRSIPHQAEYLIVKGLGFQLGESDHGRDPIENETPPVVGPTTSQGRETADADGSRQLHKV